MYGKLFLYASDKSTPLTHINLDFIQKHSTDKNPPQSCLIAHMSDCGTYTPMMHLWYVTGDANCFFADTLRLDPCDSQEAECFPGFT